MGVVVIPSWLKVLSVLVKNNAEAWTQASNLKSAVFPSPYSVLFSLLRGHYLKTGHSPNASQVRRILLASGLPPDKVKRLAMVYKECANQSGKGWDVDSLIEEYHERIYVQSLEKAVKCLTEPVMLPGSKESVGGVQGARAILYQAEKEMDPVEKGVKDDVQSMYKRQEELGVPPIIAMPLFKGLFDLFRCELWLLSAFSGEGKTTLMLNLAVQAYLQGEQVVVISLETESYKLKWKLAVILAAKKGVPISINDIVYFRLNEKDREVFFECLHEVSAIKIKECSGTGMYEILGMLRSDPKATLVFVDNLNLTSSRNKQYFDRISEGLKSMVRFCHRSKNLSVIVLAQSNRAGHKEAVAQGRYSLTSLADSNEAERSPDGVMWILQSGYLKSIIGFSKYRMLPSDSMKTRTLTLNPDTLVFTADESGGGVQASGQGGFNPDSVDLMED